MGTEGKEKEKKSKPSLRRVLDDLNKEQKNLPEKTVSNKQYDLFTTLLSPTGEPDQLSNLLSFWDSIPRYSVSRQIQASMRNESGNLPILHKEFMSPTGELCEMELRPARIVVDGEEKDFYPSETEELIEDILRKIFLQQNHGFHQPNVGESWCKFSVNMIVKELRNHGKVRSHDEVKQAIEIMENCRLQITVNGKQAYSSQILADKVIADRSDYVANSNALSAVRFSTLISRAIDKYDYRQFNYGIMIDLKSQLSRWLFKKLSGTYINAGLDAPAYKLVFSDVDRDSGLMHHTVLTRRIASLRQALDELVENGTLSKYDEDPLREGRKIVDMTFMLYPSSIFIKDMKAANARQKQLRENNNPKLK